MLLKWSADDPVSEKEMNRNNGVYSIQNNRNPFIDHPELADFIWGSRKNEKWSEDVGPSETEVFFYVHFEAETEKLFVNINKPEQTTYIISTLNGITLKTGYLSIEGTVSVEELDNGIYVLIVYGGTKRNVTKLIIEHKHS